MENLRPLGPSPCDDDPDPNIEAILEKYDFQYILGQVKLMTHLHPRITHPVLRFMELEDIAQEVYVSLWQKLQDASIQSPGTYIARMIRNKFIDVIRHNERRISAQLLSEFEDWDVLESEKITAHSEGMTDPAEELEEQIALAERTDKVVEAVAELPSRQQRAMQRFILDHVDNHAQFAKKFKARNMDDYQPKDKNDARLLNASISVARQKLASSLNVDVSFYRQVRHTSLSSKRISA